MTTLVLLAKAPVAGRVKTRLCPPCTPEQAAMLAAAAIHDTADALRAVPATRRVLALDGDHVPEGTCDFDVIPQRAGDLDVRLAGAFSDAFAFGAPPVVLVGMDTPQITATLVHDACRRLGGADSVLGLAADGGWWCAGLHTDDPQVFLDVPMSTPETGRHQLARMRARGLEPDLLPELRDVDHIADAHAVASLAPASRFARRLAELGA